MLLIHVSVPKCLFDQCTKNEVQEPADLVTFSEEILNGKFHFLCSGHNNFPLDTERKFNVLRRSGFVY